MRFLISLFVAAVCAAGAWTQGVGSWSLLSPYAGADQVAETDGRVYVSSAGSLFFFDKATEEAGTLNRLNRLNGTGVTGVYVNYPRNYLLVAYQDGNLDKVYDDGRVVNVPDFRDAIITDTHKIYDVAFDPANDRFYLCTRIGLVTFSDSKNEVRTTLYTPLPVWSAARMGSRLLMLLQADAPGYRRTPMWADLSDGREPQKMEQFSLLKNPDGTDFFPGGHGFYQLFPASDTRVYVLMDPAVRDLVKFDIDWDKTTASFTRVEDPVTKARATGCSTPLPIGEHIYTASNKNALYTLAPAEASATLLPPSLGGKQLSDRDGTASLWVADKEGLAQYALAGGDTAGEPTRLRDPWLPSPLSVRDCRLITPTPSGRFLVYNGLNATDYMAMDVMTPTASGMDFRSVAPTEGVEAYYRRNITVANGDDPKRIAAAYVAAEDPDNPDQVFVGDWFEGIYGFADGRQTRLYNKQNAPLGEIKADYASPVVQMFFGPEGSLWEFQETLEGEPQMAVLTREGRNKPTTTPADWRQLNIKGFKGNRYGAAMMVPGSDTWVHYGLTGLMVCQTQGTGNPADDRVALFSRFCDQDAKYFDQGNPTCMAFDHDGRLWLGSDKGVVEVTNIHAAPSWDDAVPINHLKVPRNDGTNLADYLLDNQSVLSIAVDPANRKWVTTNESGVYLVSESGNEILQHFTRDNSPLPTNQVYSVACHPQNNIVYFGTPDGLLEYRSSAAPAAQTLSDVYAYPNPVRPDYSGVITIAGLMDNSLVKIADAAGNVFFQGRSEGGMLTWDGCTPSGERVRSGVYFVYASQNQNGSASGAVAKIMIIR